jgi:hypothetical protein
MNRGLQLVLSPVSGPNDPSRLTHVAGDHPSWRKS